MAAFTISRLHTTQGIYRLTGEWNINSRKNGDLSNETKNNVDHKISIHTIDVMGTDGWLALKQESNTELIDKLRGEIVLHLQSKQ